MENLPLNPSKSSRAKKSKLNNQFLDRVSILKHGGASLAVYIIITAFHQLFPIEWQNAFVIRWIACISCIMVSYLFFLQETYRDQLAYFLMVINGLGMFLSCSGINAIHNDIAQSVMADSNARKHKTLSSLHQNLELASVDFSFLIKPINWWQSQAEINKLNSVDSLAKEVNSLKRQISRFESQNIPDTSCTPANISSSNFFKNLNNNNDNSIAADSHFAVVAASKMNTLYVGVDNPLRISVPGINLKDLDISLRGRGSIKKIRDGEFSAHVDTSGRCYIDIYAGTGNQRRFIDSVFFRVKRIPDPVIMTSGRLRGGNVQAGTMRAQSGILANLENFDFDADFKVVSFELVFSSKGEIFKAESMGSGFTPEMMDFISRAKPKDLLFFDEVKVVGPDNQPRKIGQIVFTVI